jgi:hypothetical protein
LGALRGTSRNATSLSRRAFLGMPSSRSLTALRDISMVHR